MAKSRKVIKSDYKIQCEALKIKGNKKICPGSAKTKKREKFIIGARTPIPNRMCARAFSVIYPTAMAMRFSENIPWERGKGYFDIVCPDTYVVYRLSRVKR